MLNKPLIRSLCLNFRSLILSIYSLKVHTAYECWKFKFLHPLCEVNPSHSTAHSTWKATYFILLNGTKTTWSFTDIYQAITRQDKFTH